MNIKFKLKISIAWLVKLISKTRLDINLIGLNIALNINLSLIITSNTNLNLTWINLLSLIRTLSLTLKSIARLNNQSINWNEFFIKLNWLKLRAKWNGWLIIKFWASKCYLNFIKFYKWY